ncbi:MAG: nuclear transport factor 2 family protein [Bacteroidota bacterium]
MKYYLIVFAALFSFHISHGQIVKNGDPEAIEQILQNAADFSKHVMAGNVDGIVASYTDDAKIFPNGGKILDGTNIERYWTPREGYKTVFHKISPEEVTVINDTAYDYGYYEGATENPDGQVSKWAGKYVIVWKKTDTQWKMYLDIWNTTK